MAGWTAKEIIGLIENMGERGKALNPHLQDMLTELGYRQITEQEREENKNLLAEVSKMRHALDLQVFLLLKDYEKKYGRSYYG